MKAQEKAYMGVVRIALSILLLAFLSVPPTQGGTANSPGYDVLKVNHEYIDLDGNTQNEIGNLVERARYQNDLASLKSVTGIRFFVHWKVPSTQMHQLTVKIEARGLDSGTGREVTEVLTKSYLDIPSFSGWATLDLTGEVYKKFGKMMAWKVSLWQGREMKTSRHSFTWDDSYSSTQVFNRNQNPSRKGL